MRTPLKNLWAGTLVAAGSLAILAGCGADEKKPPATADDTAARAAGAHASGEMPEPLVTTTPAPASASAADQGAPVVIEEEVRAACNLPDDREEGPRFDFDEVELSERDVEILDAVATCLGEGELEGESIRIIGHADPRGSDEYNMQLGMLRAVAVRKYLYEKGVPPGAIVVVSKGERQATGDDEQEFALDRRVEIEIARPLASEDKNPY